LQYILGTCNFMGLELAVNPSVLVPRPETEQLVEQAIKSLNSPSFVQRGDRGVFNILDIGTGSGNIAIALAKFVPGSHIVSVDISPQALELARTNANKHKVENQIQFVQDDILVVNRSPWASDCNKGLFDLIISNPPYIPSDQLKNLPLDVQQEPSLALDGGKDGLNFYRIVIKYTPPLLRTGACLMMEFGDGQADAIKKLFEDQRAFSNLEIIQDLAGRDRIIKAFL